MKKLLNILFATLAIAIGIYPIIYFLFDRKFGLLQSKSDILLSDVLWNTSFYGHIVFGGLALLIGWTQFNKKLRATKIKVHRLIGKLYVFFVWISALGSFYIAFFATGGWISSTGFLLLGLIWFYTTTQAYLHIRNKRIEHHQHMMIYSYAACFAAVTLRIWLPLLIMLFHDFIPAYRIVAYLCWVPNLIVAYIIVGQVKKSFSTSIS